MLGDDDKYARRRRPSRFRGLAIALLLTLIVSFICYYFLVDRTATDNDQHSYDVVIIPGGGLDASQPAAWVAARLDAALQHDKSTAYYLVLSRGTTHKPPPLDEAGYPIDEAAASARYLVAKGVAPARVLLESWSLDTIGNAAFARLMHAEPRGWRRIHVVTSAFHLPRTKAIFDWVFALPFSGRRSSSSAVTAITYEEAPERGMDAEQSGSRREKEAKALEALRQGAMARIKDLAALHSFLFVEHSAYKATSEEDFHQSREAQRAKGTLATTY